MVTYTILAVGKLKENYWREAAAEYQRRLSAYARLLFVEVPDRDREALASPGQGVELVQALEAADIARRIPAGAHVIALDSKGRQHDSPALAVRLDELKLAGCSHVCFVLGGSHGLAHKLLTEADERLSMGKLTWPHNLARVMLLEQLYRAARISAGHPYHK
jgi:23S rRNA (pseudouridine1915-N3)-methyltransferase